MKLLRLPCSTSRRRFPQLIFIVAIALCAAAYACNVPVFRFALERWRPDPYRITVFHHGPLTDEQREILGPLLDQQDKALANAMVVTVDIEESADATAVNSSDRLLLEALKPPEFPWLVVRYPQHLKIEVPISSQPLAREPIARLLDSPVRQELVRRLADGQTAVWLLLESGQAEKDDAAAALLTAELKKLESELKLPELTAAPEDELFAATPLKIAFSLVRVPRTGAESDLVAMLLSSEPDLVTLPEPMVFPVFGRGRALLALIGAGITEKNIHDAAEFLVGPCSCQVKEQNPGFDLLLSADWQTLVRLDSDSAPVLVTQTSSLSPTGQPDLVPIPAGTAQKPLVAAATPPAPADLVVEIGSAPRVWILGGLAVIGIVVIALAVGLTSGSRAQL